MFAVIKTGGKQYMAVPGQKLRIEKIVGKEGDTVDFKEVLLIENGGEVKLGTPFLEGAVVQAKITKLGKADKVHVLKYKSKSRYSVTKNHRQQFAEIEVLSIK
jgi:large subunit ribosomal protein L21